MTITDKSWKRMGRRALAVLVAATLAGSLAACSTTNGGNQEPTVTGNVADSESVLDSLDSATKIRVKKSAVALGDRWRVFADDVEIGEIRGVPIYTIGDTYSLFSKSGNLVASEGEAYRVVHHRAVLYDYNNEPRGEIKEIFSVVFANYEIKGADGELRGTASQNLDLTLNFDIRGKSGAEEWRISKEWIAFGADLTIEAKSKDRHVEAIDAVWIAVIANEIEEAQSE